MTPRLLDEWECVAVRLRRAPSAALFLDFDGTLAPLMDDPKQVAMNRTVRLALLRLARLPQVHTWIISGRRQEDLEAVTAAIPGLTRLGLHGGAADARMSKRAAKTVTDARRALLSRLNGSKGVMIENKGATFAVHHRNATDQETGHARRLLDRIIAKRPGALRVVPGDHVWEVLPSQIRGKGDTVRREWRRRLPEAVPIYIGNDGTDESAFAALAGGITARVGPAKPTRAHYSLRDCHEVARVLEQLEEEMRGTPSHANS